MISKTKISNRAKKKTNQELAEAIMIAKKTNQLEIASILSKPTRQSIGINLYELDKEAKDGETIIFPGKVLGHGELGKKIKIIAVSFSSSAKEKLKKAKIPISTIREELEGNKKLDGRIIKWKAE